MYEHFKHLNFILFVDFVTLVDIFPFYDINLDVVNLFVDLSFFDFRDFELYCS